MSIRRIDFNTSILEGPPGFRLLFIPDGLNTPPDRLLAARAAWEQVKTVHPFHLCGQEHHPAAGAINAYCWLDNMPSLSFVQTGPRITLQSGVGVSLANDLVNQNVNEGGQDPFSAGTFWPLSGLFGRRGGLAVVLATGSNPGELYELVASDAIPIPLVVVNVTGNKWQQVIARALGQAYAGLLDEFELSDSSFLKADAQDLDLQAANVFFLSQARRDRLAQGDQVGLSDLIHWPLTTKPPSFVAHSGNDADVTKHPAQGGLRFVEGGGGFRFNAFRCDTDCIMRRTPYSTTLPVQDDADFCQVCRTVLETMLNGAPEFNAQVPGSAEIDRQRLLFNRTSWKQVATPVVLKGSSGQTSTTGVTLLNASPFWSYDVSLDATAGLKISNVTLQGRDTEFDLFAAATNVLQQVTFESLSVTYTLDGTTQTQQLSYADAFADPGGVTFRVNKDGSNLMQTGVKASFTWTIPKVMVVEVETSFMTRSVKPDIDPGGAALAAKYFPQMAIRYRRVSRGGKKLKVESLNGSIVIVMNNVIPTGITFPAGVSVSDHVAHLANGKHTAGLFTDSNSSDDDSVYDESGTFELGSITWISGRKLASVGTTKGGQARRLHRHSHLPGLPHWSWLFDYVLPRIGTKKTFVAVYHTADPGETDKSEDKAFDGGLPRSKMFHWPLDQDQLPLNSPKNYQMRIDRRSRQGAYDNIHVAADHGAVDPPVQDPNATLTSAPFCADMCNHLHWRWGSVGIAVASQSYAFLGWGVGKVGQGANRVLGTPLIPPNQHLDVTVDPTASDRTTITYAVTARRPGEKQWQVVLEMGIGFAFSYHGNIKRGDLFKLATALGVPVTSSVFTVVDLIRDKLPQADADLRDVFHGIYSAIKFFDPGDDNTQNLILQTPVVDGADGLFTPPDDVEKF